MKIVKGDTCMADGTTEQHGKLPKISVVTPSYNQGQFLEQTIQSVLSQDYQNLEYIVIDGGSTDNSIEIIKRYENQLTYWVSEPDAGQSDAINKGFRMATGEVLAWLNSDDIYLPGTLFKVADYLQKHPGIGCVYGDLIMMDQSGDILSTKKVTPFQFRMALYSACMIPQPSAFWTKEAWTKTGKLDTSLHYMMDFEFFLRMASQNIKFGCIYEPLAAFRFHSTSKSVAEYEVKFAQDRLAIYRRYSRLRFKNKAIEQTVFKMLKWLYRTKGFAVRALTRGDIIPFRATAARKSV